MVHRELHDFVIADQIRPAIAEIGDVDLALVLQGHDRRRSHASAFGLRAAGGDDRFVGFLHRSQERLVRCFIAADAGVHGTWHDLDGHAAGHLAPILAAHPVCDDEQTLTEIHDEVVFVVGTYSLERAAADVQHEIRAFERLRSRPSIRLPTFPCYTFMGLVQLYEACRDFDNAYFIFRTNRRKSGAAGT